MPGQGDKVVLKVNKLSSIKTQLPYEYYSMPYCRPEKITLSAETLGEVLRGDRIENSPYEVRPVGFQLCRNLVRSAGADAVCGGQIFIRVDEQCKVLCKIDALTANQAKAFKSKIEDDYRVLMYVLFAARLGYKQREVALQLSFAMRSYRILDNLPVMVVDVRDDHGMPYTKYDRGFMIGKMEVGMQLFRPKIDLDSQPGPCWSTVREMWRLACMPICLYLWQGSLIKALPWQEIRPM